MSASRSLNQPHRILLIAAMLWGFSCCAAPLHAELLAGAAKVDITDRTGPVNDPLYVKALALRSGPTTAVLITLDAVAVGEIGSIKSDHLPTLRARLQ
ncbi:MAG TPA: hypothetical protein VM452_19530, partial [Caulifigura sp.]|nr:hypothetical protein [Caulifigura sp.]